MSTVSARTQQNGINLLDVIDNSHTSNQAPSILETHHPKCLMAVAERILADLAGGVQLDAKRLREHMTAEFGGSDAEGFWVWRQVYEAQEIATVLFTRKYRKALEQRGVLKAHATYQKLYEMLPTHTRRSERSDQWQQFSTPADLGFVMAQAAQITTTDVVLEPSAGTGMLAMFAEHAELHLNELEPSRGAVLDLLFPAVKTSRVKGEVINDLMPANAPTVVLMNPPFSKSPTLNRSTSLVTGQHVESAFARLVDGGRLVMLTGKNFSPASGQWRETFRRIQRSGTVVFSAPLAGNIYTKHGTSFDTRMTVIDKLPAKNPKVFQGLLDHTIADTRQLLELIQERVPARPSISPELSIKRQPALAPRATSKPLPQSDKLAASASTAQISEPVKISYETLDWLPVDDQLTDDLYETYTPQAIRIPEAMDHPTKLVQSTAMASVSPPKPTYQPILSKDLIETGVLSAAQIESVIYAGEAHSKLLDGEYCITKTYDMANEVAVEADDTISKVQFRRGWFLGDGTGCGKGRQVAAIIMDNFNQGRKRAVWISENDKLLEDAKRDWVALGGRQTEVMPLSKFKTGTDIALPSGILFVTYGLLRQSGRNGKGSRLDQIVKWLGSDFDGAIMFDESHALSNATTVKGKRGFQTASKQALAGLRLQRALPNSRVTYVSATGATEVSNLAYAERLGLWGEGTAFNNRSRFISNMEKAGVAGMEVISRDLKAMGSYLARSLTFDGVTVEMLEHSLSDQQKHIYDSYAKTYHIIHENLERALEATKVMYEGNSLSKNAMSAARSAFEGSKQRFFNHLLTAMKCPTLIKSIEADIERGDAVIIQLVSTGEALLQRRLDQIPVSEWSDLNVDITPREYVLDYLMAGFPTQLHEMYHDEDGNLQSRPLTHEDGTPVENKEALAIRDRLVEKLASLPPIPSALDQIIYHFGHDAVSEVTGRSLRLIRDEEGKTSVQKRLASSNLSDANAFMDDERQILIFSNAGGTGRSYHADLSRKNQRQRVHYLLEPGWRANKAIQGLGRSNRTNQASAPIFRPVATDVKGEKRFLSTIARRLDNLGAITKGQRQTGGQGLFRSTDNLESPIANSALNRLYAHLVRGVFDDVTLDDFEAQTGLSLLHQGHLRENLPSMSQFLNRVLAMTIDAQNSLFTHFETILNQLYEELSEAGQLDQGVETIRSHKLEVLDTKSILTVDGKPLTQAFNIRRSDPLVKTDIEEVLSFADGQTRFLKNTKSGRVALCQRTMAWTDENGIPMPRVKLVRPAKSVFMFQTELDKSNWIDVSLDTFKEAWIAEYNDLPDHMTSTFYLVCGLLLPLWDKLPSDNQRVYRLQTDAGDVLLGRCITDTEANALFQSVGVDAPTLAPNQIWEAVMSQAQSVALANGIRLRRSRIMGLDRFEVDVTLAKDFDLHTLKDLGCQTEIIQYRLRGFVPDRTDKCEIINRLLEISPLKA